MPRLVGDAGSRLKHRDSKNAELSRARHCEEWTRDVAIYLYNRLLRKYTRNDSYISPMWIAILAFLIL